MIINNALRRFSLLLKGESELFIETIGELRFKMLKFDEIEKDFYQEMYNATEELKKENKVMNVKHKIGSYICECDVTPDYGNEVYNKWKTIIQKYADKNILKIKSEKVGIFV